MMCSKEDWPVVDCLTMHSRVSKNIITWAFLQWGMGKEIHHYLKQISTMSCVPMVSTKELTALALVNH